MADKQRSIRYSAGSMQKIIPHLWFDTQAKEAATFYTTVFPGAKILSSTLLSGTPSGNVEIVNFEVYGLRFGSISAGPFFKINPSISFMINFDPSKQADAGEELDRVWKALSEGGTVRMPIGEYPFSKRYGWIEDRFGVNWQLILTDPAGEPRPKLMPALLFTQSLAGKAEEATNYYLSVFKGGKRGNLARYPAGMEPDKEGTIMFTDVELAGQWFVAMDSAQKHDFLFNEAVSLMVECETQEEIDYYWEKLSAVPEAEQCGWLKDQFGISWQIVPSDMDAMMSKGTPEQRARVTHAFLQMKKFDLATLRRAYEGAM